MEAAAALLPVSVSVTVREAGCGSKRVEAGGRAEARNTPTPDTSHL